MRKYTLCNLILLILIGSSCKKYLDKKPDETFAVLSTLEDMQSFLDDNTTMNLRYPVISEILADNFYLSDNDWSGLTLQVHKDLYIWQKVDVGFEESWPYKPILYCNAVLDEIEKIDYNTNIPRYNNVKGSAYFFRGFYHFSVAQLYCGIYKEATAEAEMGIPLRLNADLEEVSTRSSIAASYNQIINDLKTAATLLPEKPLEFIKTRPSKTAAYGMLAKVYLSMQKYDSALLYSDKTLGLYDSLINFNNTTEININASAPFRRFNKEVIFHARSVNPSILTQSRAKIDSNLYWSYTQNDLRKTAYFRANTGANTGTYAFKGDYDGRGSSSGYVFAGIVTDELFLIRAESNARLGHTNEALADINALAATRYETATFASFTANSPEEALNIILKERRKELFFRGTRWTDLKRLALEPGRAVILKRKIRGQEYELLPESPRYIVPIPFLVISKTGMPQNP